MSGNWTKMDYDDHGNVIRFENDDGYWVKREYDKNNNLIYYENSEGTIIDNRPKEIITINGKRYQEI